MEKVSNLFYLLLILFSCRDLNSTEVKPAGSFLNPTTAFPIDTPFTFPCPLPPIRWDERGFGIGKIDLGGLQVSQFSITTSTSEIVWRTKEGGPSNMGITVFNAINLPPTFFTLGMYVQPNSRQLSGWVLVGRDLTGDSLRPPIDYVDIGNTSSLDIDQDGAAFFWLPKCPNGYEAVGLFVTTYSIKPLIDERYISCVRSDLTELSESDDTWAWKKNEMSISCLRPLNRGGESTGVYTGTFTFQKNFLTNPSIFCLKNRKFDLSNMPSQDQTSVLFHAYAPLIYFHPDEEFLPSSVNWFFENGALLFKKGDESNPTLVQPNGANLPQGGSNDGQFWLGYPADKDSSEMLKRGDLWRTKTYLHVKPSLGGTFTDIVVWLFYPFNGPASLKFLFIKSLPLRPFGEHIGDWEHVTLRISNFNGELWRVYFSQHGGGSLVEACDLEFGEGNKIVTYSSLHGHAMFPRPGLVVQGKYGTGLRNDMAKSEMFFDAGVDYEVISGPGITEPAWVNYFRKWGPLVQHDIGKTLDGIAKRLPGILEKDFRNLVSKLPRDVLEENGPTGPKVKSSWVGDEKQPLTSEMEEIQETN